MKGNASCHIPNDNYRKGYERTFGKINYKCQGKGINMDERKLGVLEVTDEARRAQVKRALENLWDALDLSGESRIILNDDHKKWGDHYRLYIFIGHSLLGTDCPEKEILC